MAAFFVAVLRCTIKRSLGLCLRRGMLTFFCSVHRRPERDFLQWQCVADLRLAAGACTDLLADIQSDRGEDVSLFLVRIFEERDAAGAIRIVFDPDDLRLDSAPLALEINDPVLLLV